MSFALLMMPSPSRSHCTAAPAMNALPSSAYVVLPPTRHATVVTRPCSLRIGRGRRCSSARRRRCRRCTSRRPRAKQAWPKSAACWSPAMPAMGMPVRQEADAARAADDLGAADDLRQDLLAARGRARSSSGSHSARARFMSSVREALVTSVTWTAPPVSSLDEEASRSCRTRARPARRARARRSTWSRSQAIFVALKYASRTSPVFSRTRATVRGVLLERVADVGRAPALPDDGEVDGLARRAVPDDRRLALVGDADGGDVLAARPRRPARAPRHARLDARPDLRGVVLDPAGLREVLRELGRRAAERLARGRPSTTTSAVVPVVPWSMARRCLAMQTRVDRRVALVKRGRGPQRERGSREDARQEPRKAAACRRHDAAEPRAMSELVPTPRLERLASPRRGRWPCR